MSDVPTQREEIRGLTGLWWLPLLLGVLGIVAGVLVLLKPGDSLTTLAVIAGIFVLVDGIVELVTSLGGGTQDRGLLALVGVLNLIVGVLLIRHPVGGVTFMAVMLGVWLIAIGAIRFVQAFGAEGHRVWRFLIAGVELIAGIVIVSSPEIGMATFALLVGIAFIVNGVAMCLLGFAIHAASSDAVGPPRRAAHGSA